MTQRRTSCTSLSNAVSRLYASARLLRILADEKIDIDEPTRSIFFGCAIDCAYKLCNKIPVHGVFDFRGLELSECLFTFYSCGKVCLVTSVFGLSFHCFTPRKTMKN